MKKKKKSVQKVSSANTLLRPTIEVHGIHLKMCMPSRARQNKLPLNVVSGSMKQKMVTVLGLLVLILRPLQSPS